MKTKLKIYLIGSQDYPNIIPDLNEILLEYPAEAKGNVYDFIKNLNFSIDREIRIGIDSPFTAYALNNCALKGLCDIPDNDCSDIPTIPKGCIDFLQPNGDKWVSISKEGGLMGENIFDDEMKKIMNDFYNLINYYETEK